MGSCAFGGGGGVGDSATPDNGVGGSGGFTSATLSLTGGVTYKLFAGGHGTSGSGGNNNPIRYGGAGGSGSGIIIKPLMELSWDIRRWWRWWIRTTRWFWWWYKWFGWYSPWGSGGGGGTPKDVAVVEAAQEEVFPKVMVMVDLVQTVVKVEIVTLPSTRFAGGTSGISGQYNGGAGNEDGGDQGWVWVVWRPLRGGGGRKFRRFLVVVEVLGTITHHMSPSGNTYNGGSLSGQMILKGVVCQDQRHAGRVVLNSPNHK